FCKYLIRLDEDRCPVRVQKTAAAAPTQDLANLCRQMVMDALGRDDLSQTKAEKAYIESATLVVIRLAWKHLTEHGVFVAKEKKFNSLSDDWQSKWSAMQEVLGWTTPA